MNIKDFLFLVTSDFSGRNALSKQIINACLDFFGKSINIRGHKPAQILNDHDGSLISQLDNILSSNIDISNSMLHLLYCSKNRRFSRSRFHRSCDAKGPTITICRNTNGFIFGGYTSISWASPESDTYVTDDKAFLFVIHPYVKVFKVLPTQISKSIYHSRDYGPCFGDKNLWFSTHNSPSMSIYDDRDAPITYNCSSSHDITGTNRWYIVELEVYSIRNVDITALIQSKYTKYNWIHISNNKNVVYQSVTLNKKEYILLCNKYYWWSLYDIENDHYTKYYWKQHFLSGATWDTMSINQIKHILYIYSIKQKVLITIDYKHNHTNIYHLSKEAIYAKLVTVCNESNDTYLFLDMHICMPGAIVCNVNDIHNKDDVFDIQNIWQQTNLRLRCSSMLFYVKDPNNLFLFCNKQIHYCSVGDGLNEWKLYPHINIPYFMSSKSQILVAYGHVIFWFEQYSHCVSCLDTKYNKLLKSNRSVLAGYSYLPLIVKDKNNYLHFCEEAFEDIERISDLCPNGLLEATFTPYLIEGYITREFEKRNKIYIPDALKILVLKFYPLYMDQ